MSLLSPPGTVESWQINWSLWWSAPNHLMLVNSHPSLSKYGLKSINIRLNWKKSWPIGYRICEFFYQIVGNCEHYLCNVNCDKLWGVHLDSLLYMLHCIKQGQELWNSAFIGLFYHSIRKWRQRRMFCVLCLCWKGRITCSSMILLNRGLRSIL